MRAFFLFMTVLAVSVFAPVAHAYFPVQVQTYWNPQQATFQVENSYGYPIACEGQFFAQTTAAPGGIWMDFAFAPVVAGTWGYAVMVPPYAAMGDSFIAIPQVVAYCNYL